METSKVNKMAHDLALETVLFGELNGLLMQFFQTMRVLDLTCRKLDVNPFRLNGKEEPFDAVRLETNMMVGLI